MMLKRNEKKSFDSFIIVKIIFFAIFLVYAISLLLPFVWGFFMSLKTRTEFVLHFDEIFPRDWKFVNYISAWTELATGGSDMITMFGNTIWFSVCIVVVSMIMSTTAAYVVSRYQFPGKKVIVAIAFLTQIIPIFGSFAAIIRITTAVKVYDTVFMCIALATSFGYDFLILTSFFNNLSWEYAEAAFIDGAGHFQTFLMVMLPQAITPVLTLALTAFITWWKDYYNPLLYLPSYPTLSSGLYLYQIVSIRELNWPVLYSGLLLTMVPILVLFFIFQKQILDLQFGGGLKG